MSGCIGDDIVLDTVEESIKIMNPIDSIGVGKTHQFEARFLNNIGQPEERSVTWLSSDDEILTIDPSGFAVGLVAGIANITSTIDIAGKDPISDQITVVVTNEQVTVDMNNERTGSLITTSSYQFEGSFVLKETENNLVLQFFDDFEVSSALPGLYLYLTNNPNTNNNALEITKVSQFSGAQSFVLPDGIGINDYQYILGFCKPFSVKVGDGEFEN